MPGISRVRTSVVENLLTREQLDQRGITEASVAASFLADSKGWVAERRDEIVAFSIADRASRSIFALFVLPQFEGRGLGSRLLDLALDWLWANGADLVWLTTGPDTRAAALLRAPRLGRHRRDRDRRRALRAPAPDANRVKLAIVPVAGKRGKRTMARLDPGAPLSSCRVRPLRVA